MIITPGHLLHVLPAISVPDWQPGFLGVECNPRSQLPQSSFLIEKFLATFPPAHPQTPASPFDLVSTVAALRLPASDKNPARLLRRPALRADHNRALRAPAYQFRLSEYMA